ASLFGVASVFAFLALERESSQSPALEAGEVEEVKARAALSIDARNFGGATHGRLAGRDRELERELIAHGGDVRVREKGSSRTQVGRVGLGDLAALDGGARDLAAHVHAHV